MKIMNRIHEKANEKANKPGVTIAFLGDSVTQGCFELYKKSDGSIETVFDKTNAYHTYLNRIFRYYIHPCQSTSSMPESAATMRLLDLSDWSATFCNTVRIW